MRAHGERHNSPAHFAFRVLARAPPESAGVLFYCILTCINLKGAAPRERDRNAYHISPNFYAHALNMVGKITIWKIPAPRMCAPPNPHPLRGEAAVNIEFHLQVNAACGWLRVHVAFSLRPKWLPERFVRSKRCCRGIKSHISYIVFAPFRIQPPAAKLTDAFAFRVTSRLCSLWRWVIERRAAIRNHIAGQKSRRLALPGKKSTEKKRIGIYRQEALTPQGNFCTRGMFTPHAIDFFNPGHCEIIIMFSV